MTHKGERLVDPRAAEQSRLQAFEARGGLEGPVFALLPGQDNFSTASLETAFQTYQADLERLNTPHEGTTGYQRQNGYFESPDSEVLYLMVRSHAPGRVMEIGCGHSTRITRQAILDGNLDTRLDAIDPYPRKSVTHLVDTLTQSPLELTDLSVFEQLQPGDILFIDSSHQVRMSNDVAHLFCKVLPSLAPGVIIHVHDVFLPYEYPKRFFYDCPSWGEQYVLHALLQGGGYEILWPGYYLQMARPEAAQALPFLKEGRAQSFWMRKRG